MRRSTVFLVSFVFALTAGGCTTTRTVSGLCGSPPHQATCLGPMTVREDSADEYRAASRMAIDGVASPGFAVDLEQFLASSARSGRHAAAWAGVSDARQVVSGLMEGLQGVAVHTLSDASSLWWKLKSWGTNNALEGDGDGPILVNAYYKADSATFANTIAHEAAHRGPLRLSHPHYGSDNTAGLCEPPYVIGSLVQKQAEGSRWSPKGHCPLLSGEPSPRLSR